MMIGDIFHYFGILILIKTSLFIKTPKIAGLKSNLDKCQVNYEFIY